ncbi:MAG: glycine dehydrogenase, partial [Deltaproteobacteria bacterium]
MDRARYALMRYLPGTYQDIEKMLKTIGAPSVETLFESIPKEFRFEKPLDLPKTLSEIELKELISEISNQNQAHAFTQFLGGGCYAHYVPTIVNYLSAQGGFLTSYTPYQSEISQGTLRTIFEFQTMMARLTGMEVANASMYDGATSLAEACLMAKRLFPEKREILLSRGIHPEYRQVCETYTEAQDIELKSIDFDLKSGRTNLEALKAKTTDQTLAIAVQNPNFFGAIEDLSQIQTICRSKNALFIVCVTEPLSLALLKSPGGFGADIVVGETQS